MRGPGSASTVGQLLQDSAARYGDAPALLAPGREPLSYSALAQQSARVAARLRAAGVGAEGRVAVVLQNGPDMAAAFIAIASCAACAPLNPKYTRRDFEFYLGDISASALLADDATPAAATAAALALGVRVLSIRRLAGAGAFDLDIAGDSPAPADPGPTHTALLLHTSGTTSRPKLVPLSSANLAASASHIAATLALGPADRCLNIMPLFHIHGLMAALLASLYAGGSVVSTDGVYAERFFNWMQEFRPTWYTAVPTMHQAIVARAAENAAIIRSTPLRFIRSSSASLAPAVLEALESAFGAPVVEAYGMTEAAHQMASNPLPPAPRKPGSVGPAAGPEIAILDDAGNQLPRGTTGEVAIRGANVTAGYLADRGANETAFTGGWFRTGDQGRLDRDGYLYLTGRLKEIINRGGEKIAPREIDEVLLAHRAVRQALAFAVPHAQLGEEVAAAVELNPGQSADAAELRQWAAARLPAFKVPRIVRVVDAIPKGPTGKLQRIGLYKVLGVEPIDDTVLGDYVAPRTPLERRIAAVWRNLLPGARCGVEDRFEALGGDSLLAAGMLAAVSAAEGVDIPYAQFVERGTIAALASDTVAHAPATRGSLVPLETYGSRPPLFCLPGHDGALLGLARMAGLIGGDQPVYAFDLAQIGPPASVSDLAARCVSELRRAQPSGPYRLAGVCFGGVVALEMARLLTGKGESVDFLALIDALNPVWQRDAAMSVRLAARARQMRIKFAHHWRAICAATPPRALAFLARRAAAFFHHHAEETVVRLGVGGGRAILNRRMMLAHRPAPCAVDALLIRIPGRRTDAPSLGWTGSLLGCIELCDVSFDPHGAVSQANAPRVAAILAERLARLHPAPARVAKRIQ